MSNNRCILYDRDCIDCGDCRCDLNPEKVCDNCMACITGDAEYFGILVDGIRLANEQPENDKEASS
ncbi:MAG: hypothetical protein IJ708_13810 [Clostridia bacterium]|nr:hypothetical protein [Clostridia bacterium]